MCTTITSDLLMDTPRSQIAAIVLTRDGWQWEDGPSETPLTAFTADSLYGWTEGAPLTEEDAASFLADGDASTGRPWTVAPEDGDPRDVPGEDTRWEVVTASYISMGEGRAGLIPLGTELAWQEAYWIDLDTLTPVLAEGTAGWRLARTGQGHWLLGTADRWMELTPEDAAGLVYDADPDRRAGGLPDLAAMAAAARDLAGLCAWDGPVHDDPEEAARAAWAQRDRAAERVGTLRVLTDLVRTRLQPDIRSGRSAAAHTVWRAYDCNTSAAAEYLDMSRNTLGDLLK